MYFKGDVKFAILLWHVWFAEGVFAPAILQQGIVIQDDGTLFLFPLYSSFPRPVRTLSILVDCNRKYVVMLKFQNQR